MRTKTVLGVVLFAVAVFFFGCSAPRKLVSSTKETAKTEEKRTEATAGDVTCFVNTTKKNGVEVTYTKVGFYPPVAEVRADTSEWVKVDSRPFDAGYSYTERRPELKQPGAIKSIESYTLKHKTEAAGVTQDEQKTETAKTEEIKTDTDKGADITEKPAPDPCRWRYILAILVLLAAVFFWLRKKNVFTGIVGFFRRLF